MKTHAVTTNALIFDKDKKMLMVKRSLNDTAFPGDWELPGGGLEFGEDIQESLVREVLEECGLGVLVGPPLGVHLFDLQENDKEVQVTEITYFCEIKDNNQQVVLSHEHSDYRWLTKEETKNLELSEYMKKVVEDALSNPLLASV